MDTRYTWLFLVSSFAASSIFPTSASEASLRWNPDSCKPLIIAHRGASGYVPEHTLGAYALAITMGSDYVEPDLVMTKDYHLVARHENELTLSTNVAELKQFADRYSTKTVDGIEVSGWFTEDFTLEELKTLKVVERIPNIRPGNARIKKAFEIPTLQEIIDLVKAMEISEKRKIGIYPELKHPTYFAHLGLPMERPIVDVLHKNGFKNKEDHIFIQSFEVHHLQNELKHLTNLRLIQLFGARTTQPYDQAFLGTGLTYGDMATVEGLKNISVYAHGVGPEKAYIIPRDGQNILGSPTTFVQDAHDAGLLVHPYTFRAENIFLPEQHRNGTLATELGDFSAELRAFIETGIDGLFADQPDVPISMRVCEPGSNEPDDSESGAMHLEVFGSLILCTAWQVTFSNLRLSGQP